MFDVKVLRSAQHAHCETLIPLKVMFPEADVPVVAESFFSNLKSEQIKTRIYSTRAEAKSEIFDYI